MMRPRPSGLRRSSPTRIGVRCAASEAARLAAIVEASWAAFERIAAAAPEDLRKGPRGGGRDRTKVVEHVHGGDDSYASVIGIPAADRRSSPALRERILTILREPSDGSPIAGKRWPPRYAARRIAWHALDHAWEIEDRTEAGLTEPARAGAGTAGPFGAQAGGRRSRSDAGCSGRLRVLRPISGDRCPRHTPATGLASQGGVVRSWIR